LEHHVAIFFILVALACGIGFVIWQKRRIEAKNKKGVALHPLISFAPSFARIIKNVSFRDALHFARASELIYNGVISELNSSVSDAAPGGLIVGLQVMDAVESRNLIFAKFPDATAKMLREDSAVQLMTKNGERLLVAVDRDGKQFISHAKQVDPSVVSRISSMGAMVVGAAHVISGYDNAKKLRAIDSKMDLQLEYQDNELRSQLLVFYWNRFASSGKIEMGFQSMCEMSRSRCSIFWAHSRVWQVPKSVIDIPNSARAAMSMSFTSKLSMICVSLFVV
jgi:hypothetical protein